MEVEAAAGDAELVVCCSGAPLLEPELAGRCAVLWLDESPPPSPPPSAAPITKITSASTIQNVRFGSPHNRDEGGGTGSRPAFGGSKLLPWMLLRCT